jgi:O-antigen/teichoic acid export membrane protein
MKRAGDFLKGFLGRQGGWILTSNLLHKIIGFGVTIFVVRLLSTDEYGNVSYALVIVNALIPVLGLGAFQSMLRFATDGHGPRAKKQTFYYAFSRGMTLTMGLAALLAISAPILGSNMPDSVHLLRIAVFSLPGFLMLEFAKGYARLFGFNRLSAVIETSYITTLLALTVILASFFGAVGYAWALVLSPLMVSLFFMSLMRLRFFSWADLPSDSRAFWVYGSWISLGSLAAQAVFAVDNLLIANLLPDAAEDLALYRVSSVIPIAALVLPSAVAASDFVKNANKKTDSQWLRSYARGYFHLFLPLTAAVCAVMWLAAPWLLRLFGAEYTQYPGLMRIFIAGIAGAYLFRVPFGNLLSAVGKANWNTYINLGSVLLALGLTYPLVLNFGVEGAAMATSIVLWLSGIANVLMFFRYLKMLSKQVK